MPTPPLAILFSVSGYELTEQEKFLLSRANPVGVTLFGRNIQNKTQLQQLIHSIKETIGRDDVLIAVDQEGGRVRRLAEPHWPAYAANIILGQLPMDQAQTAARLQAKLISRDLHEAGINLNFAPVLDVIHQETTAVIKSRAFSSSELVVASLGSAMIDEYIKCSICPCIKHLPGHGRAAVDPHLHLPRIDLPLEQLEADFYPFRQTKNCPAGMSAHIIISAVDCNRPITQSPSGIKNLIREHIGFDGFLFSDAIDMHALQGSITEKAITSLAAGCDCICYALGEINELQALATNLLPLTDQAQERLQKITNIVEKAPAALATDQDQKNYSDLIGTIAPYHDDYDATEVLNKLINKGE